MTEQRNPEFAEKYANFFKSLQELSHINKSQKMSDDENLSYILELTKFVGDHFSPEGNDVEDLLTQFEQSREKIRVIQSEGK